MREGGDARVSVVVVVPSQLRMLTEGRGRIELDVGAEDGRPPTVGATLDALRRDHPGLYDRIVTERRELRPHVNVFVGRDDIRWSGGFGTRIPRGSEVVVLPSVSGG
jgi:sulfur-carrier protein